MDRVSLPTLPVLTTKFTISDADPQTAACLDVLEESLQPVTLFLSLCSRMLRKLSMRSRLDVRWRTELPHDDSKVSFENLATDLFQVTNLMHISFILKQYICYIIILNMFRAVPCSSSGGQIVLLQPLVSSLSVNGRTVCRLRADCRWTSIDTNPYR